MTLLVSPRGAGTITNNSQSFADTWSVPNESWTTDVECAYLTANPSQGFVFDHWEWTLDFSRTEDYQGGTPSTRTWSDSQTSNSNPLKSPYIDQTPKPFDGEWWMTIATLVWEGQQYGTGYLASNRVEYSNLTITAIFKRLPTYLPIRNGAGTGLLRGANGLPLVDA